MVTSALPNKGLPLPFAGYGGSNLLAMPCVACSRRARRARAGLDRSGPTNPAVCPPPRPHDVPRTTSPNIAIAVAALALHSFPTGDRGTTGASRRHCHAVHLAHAGPTSVKSVERFQIVIALAVGLSRGCHPFVRGFVSRSRLL